MNNSWIRTEKLEQMLGFKDYDAILDFIDLPRNLEEIREDTKTIISWPTSPTKVIEAALASVYLLEQQCCQRNFWLWVNALYIIIGELWILRRDDQKKPLAEKWIKDFSLIVFTHDEYSRSILRKQLAVRFASCAEWDDDPAAIHLTPKRLGALDFKFAPYAEARFAAGRFESEESFLRWQLTRPEILWEFDNQAQTLLVAVDQIRTIICRLKELGADTSEFDRLENNLLAKKLAELENGLAELERHFDSQHRHIRAGIDKTKAARED